MTVERLRLVGADRARYFIPTAICMYLAALCCALILTSAFLVSVQNVVAVTVTGCFGLLLSVGLGVLLWNAQRRELRYTRVPTSAEAAANFAVVKSAALAAGWRILREEPARRLDAVTSVALLDAGERVVVQFRDKEVLVASICEPSVGFSLVGRRHCADHRELVRKAVSETLIQTATLK
jgi:regulator of protease activity HflC (stomatin/prohibitin superfamily)